VWAAERPLPRVYRRAAFHAISESTRDDLVRRGVARERIEVIYPGVDAAWYCPDDATPRAERPTFLYVGRLKRYKGVEIALRALAAARVRRPDLILEIAGKGEDRPRLEAVFRRLRPEIVFHAAAHKHVPMMEGNLEDAVSNNVRGTQNMGELAEAHGVECFVLISSDKAVNPVSVMGVTKRVAERLVTAVAARCGRTTSFPRRAGKCSPPPASWDPIPTPDSPGWRGSPRTPSG